MSLSRLERKDKLGHGGVTLIHERTGWALSTVSSVLNGTRRNREIEVAIARRIGLPINEVFPRRTRKMHNGQSRLKRD